MSTLKLISVITGFVSAICWFASAFVDIGMPTAYLSGPPEWIVRNTKIAKILNGCAAFTAGISVLTQAIP